MDKRVIPNYPILGPSYVLLIGFINPETNRPTWALCGWNSVVSYSHLLISFGMNHKSTELLEKIDTPVSFSIVEKEWLEKADYVGTHSTANTNKTECFEYVLNDNTPIPTCASVTLVGTKEQVLELIPCKNFIFNITKTLVSPDIEDERGLIDYKKFNPVLFTQPTFEYFRMGDKIGETKSLPFVPPELTDVL